MTIPRLPHIVHLPCLRPATQSGLFDAVAERLLAERLVATTWREALAEREALYPRGLPVPGGVAIPHTAPEHVRTDCLVVVSLDSPIPFGVMGADPQERVEVTLAVFLVLTDAQAHLPLLAGLIGGVQNPSLLAELHAAATPEQARATLERMLDAV